MPMASSSQLLFLLLLLLALASLFSPSKSAAPCASQQFSGAKTYAFCIDLPALRASLHWTYVEARSALSVAFMAPPARPDGWISWAINPTATGMMGSQALIAFKDATGQMTVKTFNISAYVLPEATNQVWFQVEESSAEFSGGVITLFATLVLPEKGIAVVNHVWQVGPAVDGEGPVEHGADPDNLKAKGTIDLLKGTAGAGAGSGTAGDPRTKRRNVSFSSSFLNFGSFFQCHNIFVFYSCSTITEIKEKVTKYCFLR